MHPVSCPPGTALDVKAGGPQHLYTYKSQLFYTKNKNHPAQFNAGLDGTVAHIMRNEGEAQLQEQAHFFPSLGGGKNKKKKQTLSYNKVYVKILKQVRI